MANSIESKGILVPVIISRIETDENDCDFEMLAGHHRINAALLIGLEHLPDIIKDCAEEERLTSYFDFMIFAIAAPLRS